MPKEHKEKINENIEIDDKNKNNKSSENKKEKVNTFESLGINPCGKEDYFNVSKKSINDIVGLTIHILNFVMDITTIHGKGRCIILIKILNTGEICKIFSSSKHIKEVLECVDKKDLPIETTIEKININNRSTSYMFT